jgi:hypothetical protein
MKGMNNHVHLIQHRYQLRGLIQDEHRLKKCEDKRGGKNIETKYRSIRESKTSTNVIHLLINMLNMQPTTSQHMFNSCITFKFYFIHFLYNNIIISIKRTISVVELLKTCVINQIFNIVWSQNCVQISFRNQGNYSYLPSIDLMHSFTPAMVIHIFSILKLIWNDDIIFQWVFLYNYKVHSRGTNIFSSSCVEAEFAAPILWRPLEFNNINRVIFIFFYFD